MAVPISAYLLSRALVFACVTFALWLRRPPFGILEALGASDGAWYVGIAVYGYPTEIGEVLGVQAYSSLVFFPLFPAVIRGVALLTGLPALPAAVLVTNVCGLASAVLLWHLTRRLTDDNVADRVCFLYCFFPGAVVLSMAYAEAVFIVIAMLCLLALQSSRWVAAGAVTALSTATRQQGVALAITSAAVAFEAVRHRRDWASLIAPALAPLGLTAFVVFLAQHTGDIAAWLKAREAWGTQPGRGVTTLFGLLGGSQYGQLMTLLAVMGVAWLVVCALVALRAKVLDLALTVYTVVIVVSIVFFTEVGPQPRYLQVAFPLFIPLAVRLSNRGNRYLTEAFAVGLAATSTMYTSGLGALP